LRILPIRNEQIELAKKFTNVYIEKKYGKNVLGVSQDDFYSFIFYGKLGELVFRDLLIEEDIPHNCEDILKPYPGEFKREGADFILTRTNETIDVKTVEKPYKIRLLVREDQFRARVHDIYIGQRARNLKEIECWGYVTGKELKNVKPMNFGYGLCRHWFLSQLHPIEEFIEKAKKGVKISAFI